ncbi:MAG: hypothetical protein GX459_05880 [Bacteroidales bacterium]|nr:hypothetical protein [Bacteroidales bacterium]
MGKKILPRLVALVLLFWVLNELYTRYIYPIDLKKIDLADSLQLVKDSCNILYLGESSNLSFSWNDRDRRRISDMAADYFPGLDWGTLNKGALHAGIYLRLLQQIPAESKVETIVVTMNLRSFGADWIHSKLENVLQRNILLLTPGPKLWNRFRMGLKAYYNPGEYKRKVLLQWHFKNDYLGPHAPYPTAQAWIDALESGQSNPSLSDSASLSLAQTFIRLFAFRIDTSTNPRIRDFDKIVELAQKRGWKLVFNILSENVEKARLLTGDALASLMMQNRDLLVKRYSRMGAIVVDNLTVVDSSLFIDKNWPTEHYAEAGRKAIARNIALALKTFYPQVFDDVKKRTHFYTDFEHPAPGFATYPTSTRKARSGKRAIALHPGQSYSPAFYLTANDTEIRGAATLIVSAFYSGHVIDNQMKLVISLENNQVRQLYRVAYPENITNKEWNEISDSVLLKPGLRPGDLLTAYCWYTGTDTVYIDDFNVRIIPTDSTWFDNFAKLKNTSPK